MRKRSKKINSMIEEIRRRGGIIGLSDDTPEEIEELFLRQVLDCPECRAEAARLEKRPLAGITDGRAS